MVFNVTQVGSQGGVGLVGILDIVGVESSSFWLKLYEFLGCKRIRTTVSHPRNGGQRQLKRLRGRICLRAYTEVTRGVFKSKRHCLLLVA